MLKIRLQRTGRKHETTFRVVLTDSKNSTKSGKYKEVLGSYDPRKGSETTILHGDRIKHWLSVGAEATGTVHNLLLSNKIIEGKKMNVLPKKTVPKKDTPEATEGTAAAPSSNAASIEEAPTDASAPTETNVPASSDETPIADPA